MAYLNVLMPIAALAALCSGCAVAQTPAVADHAAHHAATPAATGAFQWVTLGTVGGPMPQPGRNEPANLLVRRGEAHMIDAGDGAMTALVASGAEYRDLRSIWISHIHFDHIGGLFGVLGLRLQTRTASPLVIYGPPGTREIVDGLIAAMRPSARSGFGVPGEVSIDPSTGIKVVELADGDLVDLNGIKVRVAANTHYSFVPGTPEDRYFRSYSFRFDLPDRAIVYTGDTGPSERVVALAKGADLLVTEMIDLGATMSSLGRRAATLSPAERAQMQEHLSQHHLTTSEIGEIARKAGVKEVVVTHIAGGGAAKPGASAQYVAEIARSFSGPVRVAKDLDRF